MKANYEKILNGTIVESNLDHTNGYVRFDNGFQIAWKSVTDVIGGTAWSGTSVYYSDTSMGDWAKPFNTIFTVVSSVFASQYWSTCFNYSNTSAGTFRAYRPNNGAQSNKITVIGIGTWK